MRTGIVGPWLLLLSFALAALFSLATMGILGALPAGVWEGWQPATCLATACFCEALDPHSPVRQPVNAWSSLAFVLSGTIILFGGAGRISARRLPALYAALIGIASIVTGLGSAFYHASLTFSGQFFDILGMYLLAAFILVYAWERLFQLSRRTAVLTYLGLNLSLTVVQIGIPETRRYIFASVLLLGLAFEYFYRITKKPPLRGAWLDGGLGLFAGAYVVWILDNQRILCIENGLLQGHAVWHLLGAAAVWCLYQYYASQAQREIPA